MIRLFARIATRRFTLNNKYSCKDVLLHPYIFLSFVPSAFIYFILFNSLYLKMRA